MPQTNRNQVFEQGTGRLLSETVVPVPVRTVSEAEYVQARAVLRNMITTFYPGGVATGTPTNVQQRNWSIAMTTALRYLYNEMDNE